MTHEIGEEILNSNIEYCIDEFVRFYEHREMLREKWFGGMTLDELAYKHKMSQTSVKKVIYGIGDKILIRASEM